MTREETLAWAKSLKPGDKVIYKNGYSENPPCEVLEVSRVTPAGFVKTTKGYTFAQNSLDSYLEARGANDYGYIVPATKELLEGIEREEMEKSVILEARLKILKEGRNVGKIKYDRAVKILEFFEKLDGEQSAE